MDSKSEAIHIYITPIKTDQADDWETFTRSVVAPAVDSQRPELVHRVRLLRADGQTDGATLFAFIFEGGGIDDYDLKPLFVAEFGEQEGSQRLQEWQDMLAADQYGWTFHEVPLRN